MPSKYTPEVKAGLMAGFAAARDGRAFARKSKVPYQTLYGWSRMERGPAAPAVAARGRTRVRAAGLAAPSLPPPLPFEPGAFTAALAAFEAVRAAIDGVPAPIAEAVLRTHLYRLHIPGTLASPVVEAEREASA